MDVAGLLALRPGAVRAAADGWAALAGRLRARVVDLTVERSTLFVTVWVGDAADAASSRLAGLTARVEEAAVAAETAARVVGRYADDVTTARHLLDRGLALAAESGLRVQADGMVVVTGAPGPWTAQTLPTVAEQVRAALAVATEGDARCAAALAALAPHAGAVAGTVARETVPGRGTAPAMVARWWQSLTSTQRASLIMHHPEWIAWLDGIPVDARDLANRTLLQVAVSDLEAQRAGLRARLAGESLHAMLFGDELAELDAKLAGLEEIRRRLTEPGDGLPAAYLIGFDPAGDGQAVIAVGNPDVADNVLTYVPGTGANAYGLGGDLARIDRMLVSAHKLDPQANTSVVLWLGYDAPGGRWMPDIVKFADATDEFYALDASDDLHRFQDGLRVTHDGPPSHNTVLGHSYGSTTVGFAARDLGLDADDLIFVGSPGVGVDHAAELHADPEHVWAGTAPNDIIKNAIDPDQLLLNVPIVGWLADAANVEGDLVHGQDPSESAFAGQIFRVDPGSGSGAAHSAYWDLNSTSLHNITAIVTGQPEQVRR